MRESDSVRSTVALGAIACFGIAAFFRRAAPFGKMETVFQVHLDITGRRIWSCSVLLLVYNDDRALRIVERQALDPILCLSVTASIEARQLLAQMSPSTS